MLIEQNAQLVLIGTGEQHFEIALREAAAQYPHNVAVTIGYSEALAHRIEAGVDLFLMPSRFEPCGLNQLYSLRYGTLPLVHGVGGLADSVIDADSDDADANGFVFDTPDPAALADAVTRALQCYKNPKKWRQLQTNGMRQDYSWVQSAQQYEQLYTSALQRE
jgi:starch synthase